MCENSRLLWYTKSVIKVLVSLWPKERTSRSGSDCSADPNSSLSLHGNWFLSRWGRLSYPQLVPQKTLKLVWYTLHQIFHLATPWNLIRLEEVEGSLCPFRTTVSYQQYNWQYHQHLCLTNWSILNHYWSLQLRNTHYYGLCCMTC